MVGAVRRRAVRDEQRVRLRRQPGRQSGECSSRAGIVLQDHRLGGGHLLFACPAGPGQSRRVVAVRGRDRQSESQPGGSEDLHSGHCLAPEFEAREVERAELERRLLRHQDHGHDLGGGRAHGV